MAQIVLVTVSDPARLLERAVEGVLPPALDGDTWPTLRASLVLRQGGLRDDLHRLVAAQGVTGWFGSPVLLFNEMSARWGTGTDHPPLTEPERLVLLAQLLTEEKSSLFPLANIEGWLPAIDRLFGELISEGLNSSHFKVANLSATYALGDHELNELHGLYDRWTSQFHWVERTDGRDARVRLAAEIRRDPDGFAQRLEGRREIRIVGLADLRGGWRPLLQALAESPALDRVEIITSVALDLPRELNATQERVSGTPRFADALFDGPGGPADGVTLIEAPDAAREVEIVALRVRALIDAGVAPTDIAVVPRVARPLVGEIALALDRLGVPVTARRRTTLSHTAPARALRALLAAPAEEWTRHAIVEIAEHPLLDTGLDANILNALGFAQQLTSIAEWSAALADLLATCERRAAEGEDDDRRRTKLPPIDDVRRTVEAWSRVAPRLEALTRPRTTSEWFRWVISTLADGEWGIGERLLQPLHDASSWHADRRAALQIQETAAAWVAAFDEFRREDPAVDAAAFAPRLTLLLDADLITPPRTDFGVTVAEALAVAWRSVKHVFVVGLSAGAFPQRPASTGLIDNERRRVMVEGGLPIDDPDAWRDRERELFRILCAGARESLTISWPSLDGDGRDVARSAFADEASVTLARLLGAEDEEALVEQQRLLLFAPQEAVIAGFPLTDSAAAMAHAAVGANREQERDFEPSPWNGRIEDSALREWIAERYGAQYPWSATQLETVAKCRWHWFASRLLRLEPRAEADDLMEPTVRGNVMHEALHRFFERAKRVFGTPVYLLPEHESQALPLMAESLDEAWAKLAAEGAWFGPAALATIARNEISADLDKYLQFEMKYNKQRTDNRTNSSKHVHTGYEAGELQFDQKAIAAGDVTIRLRGTIDRVDRGVDDRLPDAAHYIAAIDYKSSKGSTPAGGDKAGWDDGVVLQVPLYAAALQQLHRQDAISRIEYRTLRSPEVVHQLNLVPLAKGEPQDGSDAEMQLEQALKDAGRRVLEVRDATLPALPANSCGCSPYCPARDICRIPGGPKEAKWRS